MMTVSDVLKIPSLQRLQVLAGHAGLNRQITTVSVMDAPDIYAWMNGGEFLITSAYPVKDNVPYLSPLIEKLDAAGVAAFGVKISRFIGQLPQSAIDTANRLGLPLISIPEDYAFTDIINPVLYSIVDEQASMLVQSESIHRAFIGLAIRAAHPHEILNVLRDIIGCETAFLDLYFHKIFYASGSNALREQLAGVDPSGQISHEKLAQFDSYPVANGRVLYGHILIPKDAMQSPKNDYAKTAIDYAGIVLTLNIQTRISNHRVEEKYRDEFIGDLIFDNIKSEAEAHNRARMYGWDLHKGGLVSILDVNNVKRLYLKGLDRKANTVLEDSLQKIFEISHRIMIAQFPKAIYYQLSDHIIYIISDPFDDLNRLYTQLEHTFNSIRDCVLQSTPYSVSLGVGSYLKNIKDIHLSYNQARIAINLGYQLDMFGCVLFYERLGIYRLLSTLDKTEIAQEFSTRFIEPILSYDAQYRSSLFQTLKMIIHCNWNLRATAERLFIHYNSAKYRYAKICEILDLDLHNSEQRLNMEIAIRLHYIHNKDRV